MKDAYLFHLPAVYAPAIDGEVDAYLIQLAGVGGVGRSVVFVVDLLQGLGSRLVNCVNPSSTSSLGNPKVYMSKR